MLRSLSNLALLASLSGILTACGSDDAAPSGPSNTTQDVKVELFSWWVGPGEAEALQAVIDLNKEHFPNERIYNAAAETRMDAKQLLADRIAAGDPPDLFQVNAHDLRAAVRDDAAALEPLDELFVEQGLMDSVVPEVIDDVTVDGHVYAMPVNIHRENALFYNKEIFARYDLEPPTSVAELLAVCDTLKENGVTPLATAYQGWIIRIMFNSLAMGSMGSQKFADQWSGKEPLDEQSLSDTIDLLDRVLTDYVNEDAGETDFGWTNAAQAVFDGDAAMFFHGDWAKGYFDQLGWTPDVDFGVVGAPGASDLFWYGVDTFTLPSGAKQEKAARDFLSTVASIDGQVAFNTIKGSTPMRLDVPAKQLDAMGQQVLLDLHDAKLRSLVHNRDAWDTALGEFAVSRDKSALLAAYHDNPPE
jgi:glucose/mannose transport system substrate-binding protein